MVRRRSTVALFWLCLVLFIVGLSDAQTRPPRVYWRPDNYPNPQNESALALCGLEQKGLVCDPNRKLNPYANPNENNVTEPGGSIIASLLATSALIDCLAGIVAVQDALRRIREETRCSCGQNVSEAGAHCDQYEVRGFTIAVALADYMDLSSEESR